MKTIKHIKGIQGLPGGPNEVKFDIKEFMSIDGYRIDSNDRFRPLNIIPSGSISMRNVPHPVIGVDNLGNTAMMIPDNEYKFPGDMVIEFPVFQAGGIKPRIGTRKNPDGTESTHLMRREWIPEKGWVVFPSLFQNADTSWVDLNAEYGDNWLPIYEEAKRRGEVYEFGNNEKAAIKFADKGSWKKEYYKQQGLNIKDLKKNSKLNNMRPFDNNYEMGGVSNFGYYYPDMNYFQMPMYQLGGSEEKKPFFRNIREYLSKNPLKEEEIYRRSKKYYDIYKTSREIGTNSDGTKIKSIRFWNKKGEPYGFVRVKNIKFEDGGSFEDFYSPFEMADGGISIDPNKVGEFTRKAKAAGMSVQDYANKVLSSPKGRFSTETRRQANFARNAANWKKEQGGFVGGDTNDFIQNRNKTFVNALAKRALPIIQQEAYEDAYNNFMQYGGINLDDYIDAYIENRQDALPAFLNYTHSLVPFFDNTDDYYDVGVSQYFKYGGLPKYENAGNVTDEEVNNQSQTRESVDSYRYGYPVNYFPGWQMPVGSYRYYTSEMPKIGFFFPQYGRINYDEKRGLFGRPKRIRATWESYPDGNYEPYSYGYNNSNAVNNNFNKSIGEKVREFRKNLKEPVESRRMTKEERRQFRESAKRALDKAYYSNSNDQFRMVNSLNNQPQNFGNSFLDQAFLEEQRTAFSPGFVYSNSGVYPKFLGGGYYTPYMQEDIDFSTMSPEEFAMYRTEMANMERAPKIGMQPIRAREFETLYPTKQTVDIRRRRNISGEDLANSYITGARFLTSLNDLAEARLLGEQIKKGTTAMNMMPFYSSSMASRGDWDINSGSFRPDKKVPIQFRGYPMGFNDSGYYAQAGGEMYLTDEEIAQIEAAGGQVEYLD